MANVEDKPAVPVDGLFERSFRAAVWPIIFLSFIFLLNLLSRVVPGPMLPAMERDLGLSHGGAGSLFLFISFGYLTGLMTTGYVSARLNHRWTISLSAASLGAAMLALGLSPNLWAVRFSALAVGAGAGLYLPSGVATITSLVSPEHWGKALGVHELSTNVAFIAAPQVVNVLFLFTSWRGVAAGLGVVSVLLGLAFVRFGQGGEFKSEPPSLLLYKKILLDYRIRRLALLCCLGAAGIIGVYAMIPLFLVEEVGLEPAAANNLVTVSRMPALFIALLVGWLTDRLGAFRTMAVILAFNGLATASLGLSSGGWLKAAVLLQPALAGCFFIPATAAIASCFKAETRGLAVSICASFGFMTGGGMVPTGLGVLADLGHFGAGFVVLGVLSLMGLGLTRGLKAAG